MDLFNKNNVQFIQIVKTIESSLLDDFLSDIWDYDIVEDGVVIWSTDNYYNRSVFIPFNNYLIKTEDNDLYNCTKVSF